MQKKYGCMCFIDKEFCYFYEDVYVISSFQKLHSQHFKRMYYTSYFYVVTQ